MRCLTGNPWDWIVQANNQFLNYIIAFEMNTFEGILEDMSLNELISAFDHFMNSINGIPIQLSH